MKAVQAPSKQTALLLFVIYVVAVFMIGALLAYPVFQGLQFSGVDVPFHKVVSRTQKLLALLLLIPVLVRLHQHHATGWGWPDSRRTLTSEVARGWVAGMLMMLLIATVLVVLGVRVIDFSEDGHVFGLLKVLAKALVAGLVVAVLEELWFRGGLYRLTRGFLPVWGTVLLGACIYASVHFVRPDQPLDTQVVQLWSGFLVTANSFGRFSTGQIADSWLALFVAGILLGLIRARTHSIGVCIGVHAGWVAVIKFTRSYSHIDWQNDWVFLIGRYDGVIGFLAAGVVGLLAATYYLLWIRSVNSHNNDAEPRAPAT